MPIASRRLGLAAAALAAPLFTLPRVATAQEVQGHADTASRSSGLPLQPTRVVRFRVTEGTWMSVDVSPDGNTIVFDLLGHVYTLPIEGGGARQITSGMAFNSRPRYSPDGRHLAFLSDRGGTMNLWIADADGGRARQLSSLRGYAYDATVTSPAWSPDGRTVLVSQRLGASRPGDLQPIHGRVWSLAAYDVASGRMRWVSDTAPDRARSTLNPAFTPDGQAVYAAVEPFLPQYNIQNRYQIARVDVATGRLHSALGLLASGASMGPAVSPDGRYLVFVAIGGSRPGLRVRDLRINRERWLTREVLDTPPFGSGFQSGALVPGYAFTRDSKSLIVAYGGKIRRVDMATGRTSGIPFVANVQRELGPLVVHQFTISDTAVRTRSVMQPALSPDGRWVAFRALGRIWIMELPRHGMPAGVPRRLTNDSVGEFYPSWSPDGSWLAYSTWKDAEGGALRRAYVDRSAAPMGTTGGPSKRLTADTAIYFHTAVSSDGKRIAAVRGKLAPERLLTNANSIEDAPSLEPSLVWVPAGGGPTHTITALPRPESHLRFPVDQLYLTADPNRVHVGLTSWRWDGTGRRAALAVAGHEDVSQLYFTDIGGVLSPDQRRALLTNRFTLSEVALPTGGQRKAGGSDTLDLDTIRGRPFDTPGGAAHAWGRALAPWVSWSRDSRRVIFNQGGALFVGEGGPDGWMTFARVDVALLAPVDVPRGTIVLRGARLITMRRREVIERGDLVVRDNRIVAVGPMGRVAIPGGARVVDASGKTVLPGYADVHDHVRLPMGLQADQCWHCLVRLAHGLTSVRDPYPDPQSPNDAFSYRERERAGTLIGPRIFSTGVSHSGSEPPLGTREDADNVVRPYAEYFDSETFKEYSPAGGRGARQLVSAAASAMGLNATIHTHSLAAALTAAMDGFSGIEHATTIRVYDDVAMLMAQTGATRAETYGTVLLAWDYMMSRHGWPEEWPKWRRFAPPSVRKFACFFCEREYLGATIALEDLVPLLGNAGRIATKGGRIAMGSHGDLAGIGFHYEMWLHGLGGMSNHEILRSSTIVGATAIGHGNDFGSLEPGKLADLQVLDKNPLEDIRNTTSIRYVMKNGRLYRADDLTEIWPRLKPLPSIYLWDTSRSNR